MKLTIRATLVFLVLLGSAWAIQKGVKRSKFVDETYGFTIEAPKFPGVTPTTQGVPIIFSGPAANGFSPNVNVMVQAHSTTAKAYRDLTLGQFKQLNFKMNSERMLKVSGKDALEFDYEGETGGKTLRFLSLAVIDKDRVVLVTCTSSPDGFPALESEFKACLSSLKFP